MTENQQSMRSDYSKAKGLGSAKSGVSHWINLRLTSIPLVFLFIYFLSQLNAFTSADHAVFISWVSKPVNTISLIVFIFCSFYHSMLGMEEIIIDYIHSEGKKIITLIFNKFLFLILGITSIYSILAISFGA